MDDIRNWELLKMGRSRRNWIAAATIVAILVNWSFAVYGEEEVAYDHHAAAVARKKFLLPPGSKLIIKPMIEIPFVEESELGQPPYKTISSKLEFDMPITIHLDNLGQHTLGKWTRWGQDYLHFQPDTSSHYLNSLFSHRSRPSSNAWTPKRKYRAKRALSDTMQLYDDRFHVLSKLETILESVGWSPGQSCLLRGICELHEYFIARSHASSTSTPGQYNFEGYGLVGEIALLLLSVSKTSQKTQNALQEHLAAERSGIAGNCTSYVRTCSKSIFR